MRGRCGFIFILAAGTLAVAGSWSGAQSGTVTMTATPSPALPGTTVTFRFVPKVNAPGDTLTFDFGDGAKTTITYDWTCGMLGGCGQTQHAYAGAGTFAVTATGTISSQAMAGSLSLVIQAEQVKHETYIATAAHASGYNETRWLTDVDIHNPTEAPISYSIAVLPSGTDNSRPTTHDFTLPGGDVAHYGDILGTVFSYDGAAALRIASESGSLLVNSRTYDQLTVGTFGQYVPGLSRAQAVHSGQEGRLVGLYHDSSLATGFRTNLGLLSLSPAPITVEVAFRSRLGTNWGSRTYALKAYEFRQLNRVFESVTLAQVASAYLVLRTTTVGGTFLAYASVIDNITGDPVFVPVSVREATSQP